MWSIGKSIVESEATYFNHSPLWCSQTGRGNPAGSRAQAESNKLGCFSPSGNAVEGGRKEQRCTSSRKGLQVKNELSVEHSIIKLAGWIIRISPQNGKFPEEPITLRLYCKRGSRNPEDFLLLTPPLTRYLLEKSVGLILRRQGQSWSPESVEGFCFVFVTVVWKLRGSQKGLWYNSLSLTSG